MSADVSTPSTVLPEARAEDVVPSASADEATPDRRAEWIEVRVTCPAESSELVSAILWSLGTRGIAEEACARRGRAFHRLRAFFQETPSSIESRIRESIRPLVPTCPALADITVASRPVPTIDWMAKWKDDLVPFDASARIRIVPSWSKEAERASASLDGPDEAYSGEGTDGRIHIVLDPGMAFGTGLHETTRSCLRAIDALMPSASSLPKARDPLPLDPLEGPVTILDVGTGSGILLIAAIELGARCGVGIDIDPQAITAARANCEANGVSGKVVLSDRPVDAIEGSYPLVTANILAAPLVDLAGGILARTSPGGTVVLSGMLISQADAVLSAYHRLGGILEARIPDGEWMTLVLRKKDEQKR